MEQQQNKKQHRNKMTKPRTGTFSKYCKNSTKKFDVKKQILQGPYNKQ
jgi:hypothetical protein